MIRNGFGLQIVVDGGPLGEIVHGGNTYVSAPWNRDYAIRLLVPRGRYLAICSVDGLDILTGKRASTATGSGYVLTPASHTTANDIPGFRLNDTEVARFHFGDRRDSYAARLDKPENVGVISVVFFAERTRNLGVLRSVRSGEGDTFRGATRGGGMMGGATKGGGHDMGTEFGQLFDHRVDRVGFDRGEEVARFSIEYASEKSLTAAGIKTDSPLGRVDPFPCDTAGCTPPQGWRG
jgi:hypothetical protein